MSAPSDANRVVVCGSTFNIATNEKAIALARQLELPYYPDMEKASADSCLFILIYIDRTLSLKALSTSPAQIINVDFAAASFAWRQRQSPLSEFVMKAVGGKKALEWSVLDATAGLGQDGFILAHAGCHIQLIEQSNVVHALLQDGLLRAAASEVPALVSACSRIKLHNADSKIFMSHCDEIDVVYLDPMFPERKKTAKVKKNMQVLQQLLLQVEDPIALFQAALAKARRRVVVKRPKHADFLAGQKPALEISGKASRFDIYLR